MRARNLKPSTFKNDLLATNDPLYTWVFQGLWCMADREGRLEDRPGKIHLDINPGRTLEGTVASLAWLAANEFILRYQVAGKAYIQILMFRKHQNPHVKESPSEIPAPGESSASPVQEQDCYESSRASSLTPDSPSPIAGVGAARPDARKPKGNPATRIPDDFSLTPERRAVAEAEKLPADRTFAAFRDYWIAASGAKARKHDWDATWRNWCRTQVDMNAKGQRAAPGKPSNIDDQWPQLRARAEAINFRAPNPGESASSYHTLLSREEYALEHGRSMSGPSRAAVPAVVRQ